MPLVDTGAPRRGQQKNPSLERVIARSAHKKGRVTRGDKCEDRPAIHRSFDEARDLVLLKEVDNTLDRSINRRKLIEER